MHCYFAKSLPVCKEIFHKTKYIPSYSKTFYNFSKMSQQPLTTNEELHQSIQTQREHITILLETTKQQQYFISQLREGSNINKLQSARTDHQTLALSKSVDCLRQIISELHKLFRELKQQITSNQEECIIAQASNTIETEQMNVSITHRTVSIHFELKNTSKIELI